MINLFIFLIYRQNNKYSKKLTHITVMFHMSIFHVTILTFTNSATFYGQFSSIFYLIEFKYK